MSVYAVPDLDYQQLIRKSRKLPKSVSSSALRVAILSDAATQQFVPLLRVLFADLGIEAQLYEGAFDATELESLDPASGLYRHQPQVVVIAECSQGLRSRYYHDGPAGFAEAAEKRLARIWMALRERTSAEIIQCNYAMPYERQFGNFDLLVPDTLYASVLRLNAFIASRAPLIENVTVCDVESIAGSLGRKHWFDDRLWNMAKAFCNLEMLPEVADDIVTVASQSARRKSLPVPDAPRD